MKAVDIIYRYEAGGALPKPLPTDSDAALLRLNCGNQGFAALLDHLNDESGMIQQIIPVDPRDLGLVPGSTGIPEQRPFAVVLGCSDARVPIELIFNEGPNDLFVVRVAGNGLGTEVLGSLKYAVEHLGGTLKLVVVLGHSGCGAITSAVDVFLNPGDYLTVATKHSLRNILDRSLLVVQASANKLISTFGADLISNPGYRQALIEASIVTNARSQPIRYSRNSRAASGHTCGRHSVSTISRRARYGRRASVTRKGLGWLRLRTSSPDLSNSAMRLFNQNELFLI